jgi:mannose-6-phosphate isomerase-like protein (cupin superfamily)
MTKYTEAMRKRGAEIRASQANMPQRWPRLIEFKSIDSMPRLEFSKGCASGIFLSREREGSRFYTQGYCYHAADMEDFVWNESSWDEAFYCVRGTLKFIAEDTETGETEEFVIEQGNHFWAPAGFQYTLKATGVDSIAFWTMAPVQVSGWKYTGDDPAYSLGLSEMASAAPSAG